MNIFVIAKDYKQTCSSFRQKEVCKAAYPDRSESKDQCQKLLYNEPMQYISNEVRGTKHLKSANAGNILPELCIRSRCCIFNVLSESAVQREGDVHAGNGRL